MKGNKKLIDLFKRGNSSFLKKFFFLQNPYKNRNERRKIEFSKNVKKSKKKNRFRGNFDFRGLCLSSKLSSIVMHVMMKLLPLNIKLSVQQKHLRLANNLKPESPSSKEIFVTFQVYASYQLGRLILTKIPNYVKHV